MRKTPLAKHDAPTERKLEEALARLMAGKPDDKKLRQQAQLGSLRITISSVAREAGVSRTLIGHDKCPYPTIRRKVIGIRGGTPAEGTLLSTLKQMRAELADARRREKLDLSLRGALLRRMRDLELALSRQTRRSNRKSAPASMPFIGSSLEHGTVHPFPKPSSKKHSND